MLKGAIVDSNGKDFNSQSKNLLKHARITTKNIKSKGNNQLEVKNNKELLTFIYQKSVSNIRTFI